MARLSLTRCFVTALLLLGLTPASGWAQSTFSGIVRDPSGAVLPGVTVEAASPALIERTRTVVTDDQGRYAIVDLRPGTYKLTFTLQGFATTVRDGVDLPADFTATVNAELRIGALEETVTVSGSSPVVDVKSAQRTTELERAILDALPTSRTYATEAVLAVGVKVNSQNVGGARYAAQQRLLVHGAAARDNTISVDGMKMNSMLGGGETQANHNDEANQEVTVTTGSPPAEVSAGGLYLNLIPREGGNRFAGSAFAGYTGSGFQGNNLSEKLKARGVTQTSKVDLIYDVNSSLGGPIVRDRLWFFGSQRVIANASVITNSFYADGRPGIYDQRLQNYTVRLTAQLAARHKMNAFIDRVFKTVWHDFAAGTDPEFAARYWPVPLYYTTAIKYTGTLTNRLLVDAGWGAMDNALDQFYQPGVRKVRGTPEWYANASRQDLVLQTRTVAGVPEDANYPIIYMLNGAVSYVTGSHALKTGIQWRYGNFESNTNMNADLVQRYMNGVPDSVVVYNTPVTSEEVLNADLGFYAQDSWTMGHLTVNPGLRVEYFDASIRTRGNPPGRFVGFRAFPEKTHIPQWWDVAPRFSVVYDLTGDARTAIRFGANRYNLNDTLSLTSQWDPVSVQTDTRNWRDCDFTPGTSTCSGRVLPTNGDNIAQDNEIGPTNNARFGQASTRRPDPDIQRPFTMEYTIGIDRELFPGLSIGGGWFRRNWYDLLKNVNTLVSVDDYTLFYATSPLDGKPIPIYNLNPARQGQVDIVDSTSTNRSKNRQTYDGFEATFRGRLARGTTVFGGWSADRLASVRCEGTGRIPQTGAEWSATWNPNTFYQCDESALGIPFSHDFKINAAVPLAYGFLAGIAFQSFAGRELQVNWAVPTSVFPNNRRTQAVTINLIQPGTQYRPRWNQLDLSVKRTFTVRKITFTTNLDLFNVTNGNTILDQNQNFGSSLGQPTEILQPRLLRLSTNIKF
jgi:hypothetical protein